VIIGQEREVGKEVKEEDGRDGVSS
jgi:hypothetical protein